MAVRIFLLLLSLTILVNIVLLAVSVVFGVNMYKKYGKHILIGFGVFIMFIVAVYTTLAIIGLI